MSKADFIRNADALDWVDERSPDGTAHRQRKRLSAEAGGQDLGCSLYRVPTGARPWPRHYHFANEEAVYVLAGRGTMVIGEERLPLRTGDYVALPTGEAHAHQVVNDGSEDLLFLCLSTMRHPDICMYPDSNKVGVFAGAAPGGSSKDSELKAFLPLEAELPYWDREP